MPGSSSDALPAVTETVSAPVTPVVTAEPTTAEKSESILDVVSKALGPDTGVDAGAPTAEHRSLNPETAPTTPPATTEPPLLSEEEKRTYSANAQQRIRELAAQKNDAQKALAEIAKTPEQVELRSKAERADRLTGYMNRNGISEEEVNNTLALTSMIKAGNFTAALEILTPIYTELQKRGGAVLDQDLAEDVRLGKLDRARADETQRLRARTSQSETQRQIEETRATNDRAAGEHTTFVNRVAKAADDWAAAKATSDPDWDKKSTQVTEIAELELRRRGPEAFRRMTEADVVAISEKALEEVNKRWTKFRPGNQEIRPHLGNGRASTSSDAPPKTALEAVDRALGL